MVYIYIQADVVACWSWQMLLPLYCLIECINGWGIAKMSLVFCNHQCWYIVWQMLLPCGRWNGHYRVGVMARYCHVADGIATGSCYFNLSSEVLNRTSSHMWGRWYLPMFLFRDGLLTLIYRASLMALMRFCSWADIILLLAKNKIID